MKVMLTAALLLLVSAKAHANALLDQIHLSLLDHVSTVAIIQEEKTNVALLDSIIQVGKHNGEYLAGIQAGFGNATKEEVSQEARGAKYLVGATLRLNVLLKSKLNMSPNWEFLRSLEYGPSFHYDLREKEEIWGLTIGLAFDPAPKQ